MTYFLNFNSNCLNSGLVKNILFFQVYFHIKYNKFDKFSIFLKHEEMIKLQTRTTR